MPAQRPTLAAREHGTLAVPLLPRWGPAPRVRLRQKVDERQQEQFAELAVLNERLAGNSASAARRRIEWLKLRRKHWKQIYEYVTKQDAAITLAMIEEASQQARPSCRASRPSFSHPQSTVRPAPEAVAAGTGLNTCAQPQLLRSLHACTSAHSCEWRPRHCRIRLLGPSCARLQVAAALSEDVRDRIGVVALRRHLQKLQLEVSVAHQRLHDTQVSCWVGKISWSRGPYAVYALG